MMMMAMIAWMTKLNWSKRQLSEKTKYITYIKQQKENLEWLECPVQCVWNVLEISFQSSNIQSKKYVSFSLFWLLVYLNLIAINFPIKRRASWITHLTFVVNSPFHQQLTLLFLFNTSFGLKVDLFYFIPSSTLPGTFLVQVFQPHIVRDVN